MYIVEQLGRISETDFGDIRRIYYEYAGETIREETIREAARTNVVFVARHIDSRRILGFVTIVIYNRMKGGVAQVEDLAVARESRRLGVGAALLEHCRRYAQTRHCLDYHLSTYPDNEASNALYQNTGGEMRPANTYKYRLA